MDDSDDTQTSGFAEFYAQQRHRAIQLAWLLTHEAAIAEDVVQDAFAGIYTRFDPRDDPAGSLGRTVVRGV